MRSHAPVTERAVSRREGGRRAPEPPRPRRLTPEGLLALQRGAGNAKLARMLVAREREEPAEVPPATAGQAVPDLEVSFRLDADGDGQEERKRLYIEGEGPSARLMLNTEPVLFEDFLKNNPHYHTPVVGSMVRKIRALMKRPITVNSGWQIEGLLEQLATHMKQNYAVQVPPSVWKTRKTTVIAYKTLRERVTEHLVVEPLSSRPGGDLIGTGVQNAATDYMVELRKWSGGYVRGHMLNSKLHGPGIDDNLVPISGTFNAAMKNGVEEYLKQRVTSENLVVRYEIKPYGWDTYPGTGQGGGKNIEATLPDGFTIDVQPMKLKPGFDGTKPENWVLANQGGRTFTQKHSVPGSKRFDESAAPRLLSPGVYFPEDIAGLWQNASQPQYWVFQGRLLAQDFTGKERSPVDYFDPVNLGGRDSTGKEVELKRVGDSLVVTSAPAAKAQFDALAKQLDTQLKNLNARLQETDALLPLAKAAEESIHNDLTGWHARHGGRLQELQAKRLNVAAYDGKSDYARRTLSAGHEGRAGKLQAIELAHRQRLAERDRITQGWDDFFKRELGRLQADETKFWADQDLREAEHSQLKQDKQAITWPNLEAKRTLDDIVRDQKHVRGEIFGAEQEELAVSRGLLAEWQRAQDEERLREEARAARAEPMSLANIHLDIDLSNLPALPLAMDEDERPATPSSPDRAVRTRKPKPHDARPDGYLKLVAKVVESLGKGRLQIEDRETLDKYNAWAKRYLSKLKPLLLKHRRITPEIAQAVLRSVSQDRKRHLSELGVF